MDDYQKVVAYEMHIEDLLKAVTERLNELSEQDQLDDFQKGRQLAFWEVMAGTERAAFRNLITSMLPTDRNAVISPTTLLCSLLFLSEVSGNISQKEILRTLCYHSAKADSVADNIRKCVTGDSRLSECHIGNSLWVNNYAPIQEEALAAVCHAHQVDAFMGEMGSDEINMAIQQWLNSHTGNILKGYTSIQV